MKDLIHKDESVSKYTKTLKRIFREAYESTFPVDGIQFKEVGLIKVAFVNGRLFTKEGHQWEIIKTYYQHPITQFTTFFGIPNRPLHVTKKQSWVNILDNLIGWQDDVSQFKKNINLLLTVVPVVLCFNLISIPFKFFINILKLFTEFLPYVLNERLFLASKKMVDLVDNDEHPILGPFTKGLAVLPFVLAWVTRLSYWVGRSITSPLQNFKDAWQAGKENFEPGMLGKIIGGLFAATSLLFSIATYGVLFPLAAKVIVAKVFPVITAYLPSMIINSVAWLAKMMTPVLAAIGKLWMLPTTTNTAMYGLAIVTGVGMSTVINGFHTLIKRFSDWWRRPIHSGRYKIIGSYVKEETMDKNQTNFVHKSSSCNLLMKLSKDQKQDKQVADEPGRVILRDNLMVPASASALDGNLARRKALSENLYQYRETLIEEDAPSSLSRSSSIGSFSSI